MIKLRFIALVLSVFSTFPLLAQDAIQHVEPPNWWIGMNNPDVQLLIHGKDVGYLHPRVKAEGVEIRQVIKIENPNYLFLDLRIADSAKAGKVPIEFLDKGKVVITHNWELWERETNRVATFDQSDVLYLITPDRYANGDPSNDMVAGMREKPNRTFKGGRHGGDIEGLRKNLDYIKDLGFTAIWVNPVLENDMEQYSYHGYSTTDFYKVDPRFGSNEAYRALAKEAKSKGIKLIMDMIVNHCGSFHWWMDDMPAKDWINHWPDYKITNHQKSVIQDPYVSVKDYKGFTDGWFVPTMPDLNQRHPLMANYLTQNAIWWIEYLDLAGIRMDTYPYPDMDYMSEWTRRVDEEYPNFNVVGEEWNNEPAIVAYWQEGKDNPNGYTSDLRSLMDFPLQVAVVNALNEKESWGKGWIELYNRLAMDFIYADPTELVVFPDNHDMSRIYTQLKEDYDNFVNAMVYFTTIRGVPQFYYGTEILMANPGTTDHGIIRTDFPGGWKGDKVNAFTGEGLTDQQKQAQALFKRLLNWRKDKPVIHHGQLMHFRPQDGVYVFFRYNEEEEKVMVILNKNPNPYELKLDRFAEMLSGLSSGTDVLSEQKINLSKMITLQANTPMILELK